MSYTKEQIIDALEKYYELQKTKPIEFYDPNEQTSKTNAIETAVLLFEFMDE